jgi:hypothetical protein
MRIRHCARDPREEAIKSFFALTFRGHVALACNYSRDLLNSNLASQLCQLVELVQ